MPTFISKNKAKYHNNNIIIIIEIKIPYNTTELKPNPKP